MAAPVLVRSASVREAVKPTTMPSGGLNHPGAAIMEERVPTPRDTKRRTVQLEYVAPHSATVRGNEAFLSQSPKIPSSPYAASTKTRARARSSNANSPVVTQAQDSPILARTATQDSKPASETKSPRLPRAVSDSSAFVTAHQRSPEEQRPSTQGSMSGSNRLPSRGNSYARPVAATVAPTNAQAQLSQPTYVPSGTQPHASGREPSTGRPLSSHITDYDDHKRPSTGQEHVRSKRNSAIMEFTSRILGRSNSTRRQSQQPQEGTAVKPERKNRMFPPVSLANNRPSGDTRPQTAEGATKMSAGPRKSTDSRRSSFGFSRRDSMDNKRSSKRFSFLATGFSKMSLGGGSSDEPSTENKRASWSQQPPRSRHDSKSFLGMAFGQGRARSDSSDTGSTIPPLYDSSIDDRKRVQPPRLQQSEIQRGATAPNLLSISNANAVNSQAHSEQPQTYRPQHSSASESASAAPPQSPIWPTRRPVAGSPRTYSPTEQQDQAVPRVSNDAAQPSPTYSMQQTATFPALTAMPTNKADFVNLQRPSRKFGDAHNIGGNAGSSNKARTVMDWFRRRAKERSD